MRLLIHIHPHFQIHIYLTLAGIDASFQDPNALNRPYIETIFICQPTFQSVFLRCHFRHYSYLIFVRHISIFGKGTKKF